MEKMKKIKQGILMFGMMLGIALCMNVSAYAFEATGSCGEHITYTFDASTGKLVFTGTGQMAEYSSAGRSPFYQSTEIKSVEIGSGITTVGNGVFSGCTNLAEVTIPEGVTSIGNSAFYGCGALTGITLPESLDIIWPQAFYEAGLTSMEIPEGVTTIYGSAFQNCGDLEYITIPASVDYIEAGVFNYCSKLTRIYLDCQSRFVSKLSMIDGITITAGMNYTVDGTAAIMGGTATAGTIYLEHTFDQEVASEQYIKAESTCTTKSVYYKSCVCGESSKGTEKEEVFITGTINPNNHTGGTEVKNAKEATYTEAGYTGDTYCKACGAMLQKGSVLPMLTLPEEPALQLKENYTLGNVTYKITSANTDGTGAVSITGTPNRNIKSLTIPSTVTINGIKLKVTGIDAKAYKNCRKLTKVTIGANITNIGSQAFYGCSKLKKITIKSTALTTKTVGKNAFKKISATATIKVPKKKLNAYKKFLKKKGISSTVKIKK